jgi:hypothetical protein
VLEPRLGFRRVRKWASKSGTWIALCAGLESVLRRHIREGEIMIRSAVVVALLLITVGFLAAENQKPQKRTLCIQAPPDAPSNEGRNHEEASGMGGVPVVLPVNADLILEVVQSGKLNIMPGSGDKGAAVLRNAHTAEDLWTDSRGGGWSMRGWSNRAVGRKLGGKLVEFLQRHPIS